MNLGGWAISDHDERGELHTVPMNDLELHMDEDCKCRPVRDPEYSIMWIHNSFDKRELYETGELKLN